MNAIETGKTVLQTEADAILKAIPKLDSSFAAAVDLLFNSKGRVVITGMGKSGLIGRKIAATMTSTGTPAVFLHPTEALHGDLGIIHSDDTVIALSTSGETDEVMLLLNYIKRLGIRLIALIGNPDSTLAKQSDVALDCSVEKEACPIGLVPSASSTLSLAMGDALAIALMSKKGFSEEDFRMYHPGGSIGRKLLRVKHVMHTGAAVPTIKSDMLMDAAIREINQKKFGVAVVLDDANHVLGIITDGDLRRLYLQGIDFTKSTAAQGMTKNPVTIDPGQLAVAALKKMEERAITSLVVQNPDGTLAGFLHLHDLWRTEMI
jgi:arabinose-5-phosphate isomerase